MKIEVDISKKYLFAILGLTIVLLSLIIVNAFGTSTPSTFGHSTGEIQNGTLQGDFVFNGTINAQGGITLGGVKMNSWPVLNSSTGQTCHWEKSWKTYPVEGANIPEKTSCNVGQCHFKADNINCDPSSPTCDSGISTRSCGHTSADNNEWLYCCVAS